MEIKIHLSQHYAHAAGTKIAKRNNPKNCNEFCISLLCMYSLHAATKSAFAQHLLAKKSKKIYVHALLD